MLIQLLPLVVLSQYLRPAHSCKSLFTSTESSSSNEQENKKVIGKVEDVGSRLKLQEKQDGRVRLDLFYEVLCPDSRGFMMHQLYPTFEEMPGLFFVNFIPYGKARTYQEADYSFNCQHGPAECQGNMYHACANNYIEDPSLKMEFIRCMMDNNYQPRRAVARCAREHLAVDLWSILRCGDGAEGRQLHAHAGQLTNKLSPKLSWVPTVMLNGQQENQGKMLRNLKSEICRLYQGNSTSSCQSYERI